MSLFLLTLLPIQAQAHNLWLNATDFSPELSKRAGAHSKIYFGFGHRFPVADFLDRSKLREFRLIKPNQSSQELEAGQGGFLATPVVMKKPGAYTVAAATNAAFTPCTEKMDVFAISWAVKKVWITLSSAFILRITPKP